VPPGSLVFLVALGIDDDILLMTRAREEPLRHGTRDGVLRALAVTVGSSPAPGWCSGRPSAR
jgi:RND superfamily putative drug exporter